MSFISFLTSSSEIKHKNLKNATDLPNESQILGHVENFLETNYATIINFITAYTIVNLYCTRLLSGHQPNFGSADNSLVVC